MGAATYPVVAVHAAGPAEEADGQAVAEHGGAVVLHICDQRVPVRLAPGQLVLRPCKVLHSGHLVGLGRNMCMQTAGGMGWSCSCSQILCMAWTAACRCVVGACSKLSTVPAWDISMASTRVSVLTGRADARVHHIITPVPVDVDVSQQSWISARCMRLLGGTHLQPDLKHMVLDAVRQLGHHEVHLAHNDSCLHNLRTPVGLQGVARSQQG